MADEIICSARGAGLGQNTTIAFFSTGIAKPFTMIDRSAFPIITTVKIGRNIDCTPFFWFPYTLGIFIFLHE